MLDPLMMNSTRQVSLHARSPLRRPQLCCRHHSRGLQVVFLAIDPLDSMDRPDYVFGLHVELRLQMFLLPDARGEARLSRCAAMLLVHAAETLSQAHSQTPNPRRT